MTVTVLSDRQRRAAHGRHTCQLCHQPIPARSLYTDRRVAHDGTAYTWREHTACGALVDTAARWFGLPR